MELPVVIGISICIVILLFSIVMFFKRWTKRQEECAKTVIKGLDDQPKINKQASMRDKSPPIKHRREPRGKHWVLCSEDKKKETLNNEETTINKETNKKEETTINKETNKNEETTINKETNKKEETTINKETNKKEETTIKVEKTIEVKKTIKEEKTINEEMISEETIKEKGTSNEGKKLSNEGIESSNKNAEISDDFEETIVAGDGVNTEDIVDYGDGMKTGEETITKDAENEEEDKESNLDQVKPDMVEIGTDSSKTVKVQNPVKKRVVRKIKKPDRIASQRKKRHQRNSAWYTRNDANIKKVSETLTDLYPTTGNHGKNIKAIIQSLQRTAQDLDVHGTPNEQAIERKRILAHVIPVTKDTDLEIDRLADKNGLTAILLEMEAIVAQTIDFLEETNKPYILAHWEELCSLAKLFWDNDVIKTKFQTDILNQASQAWAAAANSVPLNSKTLRIFAYIHAHVPTIEKFIYPKHKVENTDLRPRFYRES